MVTMDTTWCLKELSSENNQMIDNINNKKRKFNLIELPFFVVFLLVLDYILVFELAFSIFLSLFPYYHWYLFGEKVHL